MEIYEIKENKKQFLSLLLLVQAAELFSSSFAGAPWNDDWSDKKKRKEGGK